MNKCVICGNSVSPSKPRGGVRTTCGNESCRQVYQRNAVEKHRDKQRTKAILMEGSVVCVVCGQSFLRIVPNHLRSHGMTYSEYVALYPNAPLVCGGQSKILASSSLSRSRFQSYDGKTPDARLYEFLTGALLGDGTITRKSFGGHARYSEGGCNRAYIHWKRDFLAEYIPASEVAERTGKPHRATGKRYTGWFYKTGVHPLLTEWHAQWYLPAKSVPRELVEKWLTPFSFAVWFCDDGNLRDGKNGRAACLYTMGFSHEDASWLKQLIENRFCLSPVIRFNSSAKPYLWFPSRDLSAIKFLVKSVSPCRHGL